MSDIRIQPKPIAISRVILVLMIAAGIVLLLSWLLTGGGGEIFEAKSYLHSYMGDASGLVVKAAVQLDGIQIGKISSVRLSGVNDPKRIVWVEMKVKSRYLAAIPVDSTVTITADNLLGDRYLNILTGHRTETVREGGELRSVLPIGDQFNSADLVAALKDMLNRVDDTMKEIEDPRTPLGQFVQTEDFYDDLRAEIVSVEDTVQKFAHPRSQLGKMIFSDEFYEQIRAPLVAFDKTLAGLQSGEGQYGHLLASSQQYDDIRKSLADIRDSLAQINAGKGQMGEFTQSDKTYQQMERLVKTLGQAVDSLNAGDTQLSVYLAQGHLFESLTGATGEMREVIGDFRTNPRKYLWLKLF